MSFACPLCNHQHSKLFFKTPTREFWRCPHCALTFVPEPFCPDPRSERAHYENHQNHQLDQGYRTHLEKLALPLVERLTKQGVGLDFGSGAGCALSQIFKEHNLQCENYDLYFAPNEAVLLGRYDFITMTEVIEHLRAPGETLEQLLKQLNPGGTLAVMTQLYHEQIDFASWYYKNDPTHIALFQERTLKYISEHFALELEVIASDVIFFKN